MLKKDSLGNEKVRNTPQYTAKTHWASETKFSKIYAAPFLFVLLPLIVLFDFKAHEYLSRWIYDFANIEVNEYVVLAVMALLLWQIVVCWCIWHPFVCKFMSTPLYTYNLYGDILEYSAAPTRDFNNLPKFYKRLRAVINFVPVVLVIAALVFGCIKGVEYYQNANNDTEDTQIEEPVEEPVEVDAGDVIVICLVVSSLAAISALGLLYSGSIKKSENKAPKKAAAKKLSKKETKAEKEKAFLDVEKRFHDPDVVVPETAPKFLKKFVLRHAIRYNYGDVVLSSPMGPSDDIVFTCVAEPEKLVDYLAGIKKQPSEIANYTISR